MTDFTISGPDKDNLVWLMSGEGLQEEMRNAIADEFGDAEVEATCSWLALADRILSLPGISTSYGINLGEKEDVAELFSQWLGSIDYLEDQ